MAPLTHALLYMHLYFPHKHNIIVLVYQLYKINIPKLHLATLQWRLRWIWSSMWIDFELNWPFNQAFRLYVLYYAAYASINMTLHVYLPRNKAIFYFSCKIPNTHKCNHVRVKRVSLTVHEIYIWSECTVWHHNTIVCLFLMPLITCLAITR